MLRRHPLVAFFVLTFVIAWGLAGLFWAVRTTRLFDGGTPSVIAYAMLYPAIWAPTIAAVVVARASAGTDGLRRLKDRLLRVEVRWVWWVAAIGLPVVAQAGAIAVAEGVSQLSIARLIPDQAATFLTFAAITAVGGPLGEELGWRGFALPRLATRFGPVTAALVIGVAWVAWHIPAFFVPEISEHVLPPGLSYGAFAVITMAASVLMAWIVLQAGTSVPLAMVFHFMLLYALAGVDPDPPPALMWAGAFCFAALAVVVLAVSRGLRYPHPDRAHGHEPAGGDDRG